LRLQVAALRGGLLDEGLGPERLVSKLLEAAPAIRTA
jgi:hypothetical protein